ncbi:hypothetical protein SAMN05216480_101312 [Pustulibacterium marinum]|uniref:Lipoprotein n=1 Tax=Pustulibacterium marinum TaxID=1224947 RepID=A0A1I7EVR3_9FLAO|nr:hypothetical protein [Pustulibacterium marinum]SFU28016.1 hypothetical protein SAMN05216480_101312 [Pustulibacterium marinum]
MKYFLIFTFFLVIGCNDSVDNFPHYKTIRVNNLDLNLKSDRALNKISNLLNGGNELYSSIDTEGRFPAVTQCEVFFQLSEENKILYLRKTFYKDFSMSKLQGFIDYKLPIKDIDVNNLGFTIESSGMYRGEYAHFEINSKYSNEEAFGYCSSRVDESGNIQQIGDVSNTRFCFFPVKVEVARTLEKQLKIFIENFDQK